MREYHFSVSSLLVLVAVIVFVLGAFGVHFGGLDATREMFAGLAIFAASFLV